MSSDNVNSPLLVDSKQTSSESERDAVQWLNYLLFTTAVMFVCVGDEEVTEKKRYFLQDVKKSLLVGPDVTSDVFLKDS